jgi:hypothetical protein
MYICVCGYRARGVSSHVYMCVLWLDTHTHIYMTTRSSGLVKGHTHIYMTTRSSGLVQVIHIYTWLLTPLAWYPHTHIHDSCIYVCVGIEPEEWVVMYICVCGYQARGVSSHVYMCVCIDMTTHSSGSIPTHTYIHDYSLLWLDTHTHIYTWLLTPLARYPHTHIYMTIHSSIKPEEWVVMYICMCGYQDRGVSSHVYVCVGIKPEEWVVMYICVWPVPSQRNE